jgi:hypothetical protein
MDVRNITWEEKQEIIRKGRTHKPCRTCKFFNKTKLGIWGWDKNGVPIDEYYHSCDLLDTIIDAWNCTCKYYKPRKTHKKRKYE